MAIGIQYDPRANTTLNNIRDNHRRMGDIQSALSTGQEKLNISKDVGGYVSSLSLQKNLQELNEALRGAQTANHMTNLANNAIKSAGDLVTQMSALAERASDSSMTQDMRSQLNVQYQLLLGQLNDTTTQPSFAGERIFQYNSEAISIGTAAETIVNNIGIGASAGLFGANNMSVSLSDKANLLPSGNYGLSYVANGDNTGTLTLSLADGTNESVTIPDIERESSSKQTFMFESGVSLTFEKGTNFLNDQALQPQALHVGADSTFAPQFTQRQMQVNLMQGGSVQAGDYSLEYNYQGPVGNQDAFGTFTLTDKSGLQEKVMIGANDATMRSNAQVDFKNFGISLNFSNANLATSIDKNDNVIQASNIAMLNQNGADQAIQFSPMHITPTIQDEKAVMSGAYSLSYNIDTDTGIGTFILTKPNGLEEKAVIDQKFACVSSTIDVAFEGGVSLHFDTVDLSADIERQTDVFAIGNQSFSRDFQIGATGNEQLNIDFNVINGYSLGLMQTNIADINSAKSVLGTLEHAGITVNENLMTFSVQNTRVEKTLEDIGGAKLQHGDAYSEYTSTDYQQRLMDFKTAQVIIDVAGDVFRSNLEEMDKASALASRVLS